MHDAHGATAARALRLKTRLRVLVTWPPLNRIVTGVLRACLPARVRMQPALPRYVPRAGIVETELPGGRRLRMYSRGDDDIAAPLFWRGWAGHEPETARLFFELAESARVTLDIGAHVGYFALLAAHANPVVGRVYAFEPLERVRRRLEHNVVLNAATNVTCVPMAVGSPAGTAEFFHVREGIPSSSSLSWRFMQSIVPGDALTSSMVEVVEGDDFVDSHGLVGIDLIKVDTETTEAAVLRGMLRTLRRDRPDIICEVLDSEVASDLEALLAPIGYRFFLLTAGAPVPQEHIHPHERWHNFLFRARATADSSRPYHEPVVTRSALVRPPAAPDGTVNALTIDFEDWYQGLEIPIERWGGYEDRMELAGRRILELLAAAGARGTFFVLGAVAERHPHLVREIAAGGHEIATHGFSHTLVYQQTPAEFREELRRSIGVLEDLAQAPVIGHRAPFFSITNDSLWALDVLAEEGIRYDSSIFPTRNPRYGIVDAPRWPYAIETDGGALQEFPITTWQVRGRRVPVAGGAYFRIWPYAVTRRAFRDINRAGRSAVFYLHPWEVDPTHPRIALPNRIRLTHYVNLKATAQRLERLLRDFAFAPMQEVLHVS